MTAWRQVVQELYEKGGEQPPAYIGTDAGRKRARELGLIEYTGPGRRSRFHRVRLTDLGRDFVEGRVEVVGRAQSGGEPAGRLPSVLRATWLRALPRPEQVRPINQAEKTAHRPI